MLRRTVPAILLLALAPAPAAGAALAREGTVAILPTVRFPRGGDPAPGLTLSFGFKPNRSLEVGIDVAGTRADGGAYRLTAVPLGVSFEWTPTPEWDVRPVLNATAGKGFLSLDGPGDRTAEHTPYFAIAAAGISADLSRSLGLYADAGYAYLRAEDAAAGNLDGGGPIVRAGVYFRWDPLPERLGGF